MSDALPLSTQAWWVITHMGASSLLLPALVLVLGGLWESGARTVARTYFLRIALTITITVVSKCLFFGWGIGIAALDFTGISGHTLLATSILPLLLRGMPWPALQARSGGEAIGWALALAVGVSRVMVNAHSVSEVVAGWVLGAAVSWPTLRALGARTLTHWASKFAPLILLLAFHGNSAALLPTHEIEVRLALWVSGQGKPFMRHHLHAGHPASAPAAPAAQSAP
ncbi:MAG: phosphatase PAP2 family protein [Betaproteobacteria bacterium]|nr:phosphatase PAP2 family protein [Betaproteobacteria bacterium]